MIRPHFLRPVPLALVWALLIVGAWLLLVGLIWLAWAMVVEHSATAAIVAICIGCAWWIFILHMGEEA